MAERSQTEAWVRAAQRGDRLPLTDTAKAVEKPATIKPDERQAATGTCDAHAPDSDPIDPQQNPSYIPSSWGAKAREMTPSGALTGCCR